VFTKLEIGFLSSDWLNSNPISMGAFKSAKQLACSPSDWTRLVLTYRSNQLY